MNCKKDCSFILFLAIILSSLFPLLYSLHQKVDEQEVHYLKLKDDSGDQGPTGISGPNATPSMQLQGEPELKFDIDTVGPKGDAGDQGPRGNSGLVGISGNKGMKDKEGLKHDIGLPGLKGNNGSVGLKGDNGDPRLVGDGGDTRPQGTKGTKGEEVLLC